MLVEKAFVINLKIRRDRLNPFFKRYPKNDLFPDIEVFDAIHGDTCVAPDNWHAGNGAWGCYRSHMAIMEQCLNSGVESYIVFEDDAVFCEDFVQSAETFFGCLPDDWHQAYLGGQLLHAHAHPPIRVSDHVYKPYNVNRTHCFALNGDGILSAYRHCSNLPFHTAEHIDHHLGRWHESYKNNIYCPWKWLVGQGGSPSNVSGKHDPINFFQDPETMSIDHPLYKSQACVVFRGPREVVEQLCEDYCHKGYNLDKAGYDRTLCDAWKYKEPGPEIKKWYSHVRSEIAREQKRKIPVLWHPRITDEMIEEASLGKLFVVEEDEFEAAKEKVEDAISFVWR